MDNDSDWKPAGSQSTPRYPTQFKKTVVLFAEKFSNREAERTFGIAESNIRRWKKLKQILFSDGFVSDYAESGSGSLSSGSSKKKSSKTTPLLSASFEDSFGSPDIDHFNQINDSEEQESDKMQKKDEKSDSDCEEVCLRWNSHHHNMKNMFPMLLQKEQFVDVTLTSEGKALKCHKLILSSCSPYFENILSEVPLSQHAIIFLNTIPFWLLKIVVDFMYTGEVHIDQNKLQELLSVAEILQIKGLTGKSKENHEQEKEPQQQKEQSQKVQNIIQSPQQQKSILNQPKSKIDVKQIISKESVECKTEINENKLPLTVKTYEKKQSSQHQQESQLQQQSPHNVKIKVIKVQSDLTMPLLTPVYMEDSIETSSTNNSNKKDSPKKCHSTTKKPIRKRKSCEETTPPILYRKGTKSRPQVKVPRYYHNEDYDHGDLKALRTSNASNENVDKKEKMKKDGGEKLETSLDIISNKSVINLDDSLECSLDQVKTETLDFDETEVVFTEVPEDDVIGEEFEK